MTLKAILDSLDGLDETVSAHYQQTDEGKFRLDVSPIGGYALEDTKALKAMLSEAQEKRKKATADLMKYRDEGGSLIDISDLSELRNKVDALKDATPADKVETVVSERVAEIRKKFQKDIENREANIELLNAKLNRFVVKGDAVNAITKAGAGESLELLLPHVVERLAINAEGELPRSYVVGENGNPRLTSGEGAGEMTAEELVSEMKSQGQFARAFPGNGASGSGAPQAGGTNGTYTISRSDARDAGKYQTAKAAADKAGKDLTFQG